MNIGIGININQQQILGGAPQPFGGNFTWWANINNAVTSDSGGTLYVDSIPLTGISDQFEQPTAAQRPVFNATGLDGNATVQAVSSNQKLYKVINSAIFNGGGTFAFISKMNGNLSGQGATFFTEAAADASDYNFQLYTNASITRLQLYTNPTDGVKILQDPFTSNTWAVRHFTLSGSTFKYYRNGVLQATFTLTQNFTTARPLTMFNYKGLNSEQGIGEVGDIIALTGTALTAQEIEDDYNNFFKVKYPSLP